MIYHGKHRKTENITQEKNLLEDLGTILAIESHFCRQRIYDGLVGQWKKKINDESNSRANSILEAVY